MLRKIRIISTVIIINIFLFGMDVTCFASEGRDTNQEYIDNIIDMVTQNGDIEQDKIISSQFIYLENTQNESTQLYSLNDKQCEGVMIVTCDGNEYTSNYIIPYLIEDGELLNVTRARGTSTDSDFETSPSSSIYLKVTAKYIYYSAAETKYYGPFFRPTSFTVKWSDGTAACAVSSLQAVYSSRAQVWNMNTLTATNRTEGYISNISQSSPSKNTTYWGSAISMSSSEALALLFNGIDTYSYINVTFTYSVNGAAYKTGEVGCNVFLDSGLTS